MRRRQLPKGNVPMVTETHRRLALELRMSVELLIERPSPDSFNQLSKMLAALVRAGMASQALDAASNTMNGICDHYERIGKVGVSAAEATALRQAIAGVDGRLALVPVNKFDEAVAAVAVFCATVGA
jgi:hypothetical protein